MNSFDRLCELDSVVGCSVSSLITLVIPPKYNI